MGAAVVQRTDVRMIQAGHGARFSGEPAPTFQIGGA